MRTKRLGVSVVAAMSVAAAAPGAASAATVACGDISFTAGSTLQSSSYGAGNIRATNVSCATAKSVARGVTGESKGRYTKRGFSCRRTATIRRHVESWRCTRTVNRVPQKVTFRSYGV